MSSIVSATPLVIVPRNSLPQWLVRTTSPEVVTDTLACKVLDLLTRHGAMFTSDLEYESGLLRPQLEKALKTLIAAGSITSDAFSPIRWLLRPEAQKLKRSRVRRHGVQSTPVGRWSVAGSRPNKDNESGISDHTQSRVANVCQSLLRRYGVVFRAVVQRETLLPPWWELLKYLRRMEDRGEVRGGRFVDGFSGEQFALPEALGLLRQPIDTTQSPVLTAISACDPLNLGGLITPGAKTPALSSNRILLENGVPVARVLNEELEEFSGISELASQYARQRLLVVRPWLKPGKITHTSSLS